MNIFSDMPDIPPCPRCGHVGAGLQFAFPDSVPAFSKVQAACLACGFHAEIADDYDGAIRSFVAGEAEAA